MKKLIFLILLGLSLSGFANLPDNMELFNKANGLYSEKKFDEATEIYKKIENAGYRSADLYYNLANSYYRSNKITEAILYYEKALLLSPGDDAIIQNLTLARLQVYDKIIPTPEFSLKVWFNNASSLYSADSWAFISIGAFVILLITLVLYFFSISKNLKIITFFSAVFFLIFSTTSFIFSRHRYKELVSNDKAIIFSPVTSIKSSPDDNSTELFIVHEGLKVKISDNSGEWYEVVFENGKIGWLKKTDLKII